MHFENKIGSTLIIKNIYRAKKFKHGHKFIDPIGLSRFFTQYYSLSNPQYLGDAIIIYDLLSSGLCKIDLLAELIGRGITRNSHHKQRRRFLVLLRQLAYCIKIFEAGHKY
jgi:hypothetical protein